RSRSEGLVEQLERHAHFLVAKYRRGVEDLSDPIAMPALERAEFHGHLHSVMSVPPRTCWTPRDPPAPRRTDPARHWPAGGTARARESASSQIARMSAGYSIPATRAMRASPASGAMSGLAFTSRIHGRPAASTRMSTRP